MPFERAKKRVAGADANICKASEALRQAEAEMVRGQDMEAEAYSGESAGFRSVPPHRRVVGEGLNPQ